MVLLASGTPVFATTTYEQDEETASRRIHDMFEIALADKDDAKARARMRRAITRYVNTQIDLILDGEASELHLELRES